MHLTKEDIQALNRVKRLNLINSITGIKPANLIGTQDKARKTNLAIFSSVVHLGSDPALIGMILRPHSDVRRHTHENILETGVYTINHIPQSFIQQAHYTSAKFDKEVSEFKRCGFTEEYISDFEAPFIKESSIKIGLKLVEQVPIKANDTMLLVGEVQHLILPEEAVSKSGYIDLGSIQDVGISGLNSYYSLEKIAQFPYARPEETPEFDHA